MAKWIASIVIIAVALTLFVWGLCKGPDVLWQEPLSEADKELLNVIEYDSEEYLWGNNYYGTINGCTIVREERRSFFGYTPATPLEIAGYTFEWMTGFSLKAYRNEEFYDLQEAYEKGWLTEKQIGIIHERHSEFWQSWLACIDPANDWRGETMTSELFQEMSQAILEQHNITMKWGNYRLCGQINGVRFLMIIDRNERGTFTKQIGEETFEWNHPFEIYVYRDDTFCTLQEAYEKGWLNSLQLLRFARAHSHMDR